jgi:3-oxoacyl-(acyl-carrier-protein) synthase
MLTGSARAVATRRKRQRCRSCLAIVRHSRRSPRPKVILEISALFGDRSAQPPITAAKSYFGNLGAASGLVELIASVLALGHGKLFKVLNLETPDPRCELSLAGEEAAAGSSFLNVNVTPQGQASAVVIAKAS